MYAKCITLYLKLDQWNKVALKQKEVLALYLSLLSPFTFISPPVQLLQEFIIKCDFAFFHIPQSCLIFSPPFYFSFCTHFWRKNNKRYAGVDQPLVWKFSYSEENKMLTQNMKK